MRQSHLVLQVHQTVICDYTFTIGSHRFGFADYGQGWDTSFAPAPPPCTLLEIGPIGPFSIPVSAGTGWVIVGLVLTTYVVTAVLLNRRARRLA